MEYLQTYNTEGKGMKVVKIPEGNMSISIENTPAYKTKPEPKKKTKVMMFRGTQPEIEDRINEVLEDETKEVIDIKFNTAQSHYAPNYTVLIHYAVVEGEAN